LTPVVGTLIRTVFSLLFLLIVSFQYWSEIKTAGVKSISLIAVGGGLLAGGLGIVSLYTGLKTGNLSTVMTIAFCLAPVVTTLLGYFVLSEKLSPMQLIGIVLCITGAAMVTFFKQT